MPRRKPPPKPDPPPRRPRNSGSITTLKDGTIRARLPASLGPRRTAREFRPGQMADAVAWLDGYLHPQTATQTTTVPVTLGEWCGAWHETFVAPVRPPNTARWALYALRHLSRLYPTSLPDLRASALQGIAGQLSGRLDAATVQGIVGIWRRCLDAAVEDELLTRNPARRLVVPKASPKAVRRHVTPAEVTALWPEIIGERFEAAFALMLGCGLRIGEILGIGWEHVEFARHRVWVSRQWTNSHWRDLPKGRNPRWVHLPARVEAAMIRHHNAQPEGVTLVMQSPHVNLYGPTKRRRRAPEIRPWAAQTVRRDLVEICERLELDAMTPHAARRGLVTALLDGGASPALVAERLGHASPATTLRHYAGQSDEARQRADALIDRYLGSTPDDASGTETA